MRRVVASQGRQAVLAARPRPTSDWDPRVSWRSAARAAASAAEAPGRGRTPRARGSRLRRSGRPGGRRRRQRPPWRRRRPGPLPWRPPSGFPPARQAAADGTGRGGRRRRQAGERRGWVDGRPGRATAEAALPPAEARRSHAKRKSRKAAASALRRRILAEAAAL